jgi:thiol-disulfide isomerase/thioredoxin
MNKRIKALLCCLVFTSLFGQEAIAAGQGDLSPDCQLSAFTDHNPLSLKQWRGQVLYVDFWASWCGPCAKSFPFLNSLNSELKSQGLQVVGVNLDETPADAQGFLAKYPANFTIAADPQGLCAPLFSVQAMPSSYLIDRKGVIRHIHLGFKAGEAEELKQLVIKLLAEH